MKQRNIKILSAFILVAMVLGLTLISSVPSADAYCDARALGNFKCVGDWVQQEYIDYNCDYYWLNYDHCEYGCYDGECRDSYYPNCDSGWLNSFRCTSGDDVQRLYRYSDCREDWVKWEDCTYDCVNGHCVDTPACDIDVYSLTFNNNIQQGESTTIKTGVKNTGETWQRTTVYIYFDNVLENVYTDDLRPDGIITRTLTLRPDAGTHYVKIKAVADCGEQDIMTKTLTVRRPSYPQPPYCDYDGYCESWESSNCADCGPYEPPYEPYESTTVTIYPTTLDMRLYEGKVITIGVDSKYQQRFTIDVDGVPADWLSYTKYTTVEDEDSIYVYVTPRESGLYDLNIKVHAQSEDKDFSKTVSMYVSEKTVKEETAQGMPVTGMVPLSDQQVLVGVGVLIIIIVIVLGVIILRRP